jgi:hypothetical protein
MSNSQKLSQLVPGGNTPIPVNKGGTGTASLTGLVKGNGTGALTAAVSGTDIKTVNGVTFLGSGDIAVQVPLVSGTNIRTVNGASLLTAGNLQLGASLVGSARTANTALGIADNSALIDITSGTFTQTFSAAATLGSGWFCYIRNSGTGDITLDPNASELIDGLTSYVMYPGEVRLVQCDGVALRSVVLTAFARTFITSGTFIKPPGYSVIFTELWAGGGGGGKGTSYTTAGNGGAYMTRPVMASTIPPTVLVTVGAGGTPASVNTASGTAGGVSTLGTLVSTDSVSDSRGGNPGQAYPDIQGTFTGGRSATFSTGSTTLAGSSIFGGGAGGSFNLNATTIVPPGVSNFGGSGGSAGNAVSGSDGIIPGGGGGVTRTGPLSGAGARGEVRIWGVA